VLPAHCDAELRRGRWEEPRIFGEIQAAGDVSDDEMAHVFNLGLGMLGVVPRHQREDALDAVRAAGQEAWIVGEVSEGRGRVSITRN
jgi:phosphoribosylformylglycinamidine cyclo-ligase